MAWRADGRPATSPAGNSGVDLRPGAGTEGAMSAADSQDPAIHDSGRRDPQDARHLRDAFGTFATGVTIITARGIDGVRVGLTANSMTSVSLDPPLLLFCPARTASALPTLRATGRFAVNVLAAGQATVADRFARRGVDRFAGATWHDRDGLPMLDGALASFGCTLEAEHDGGDHVIVIGRVATLHAPGGGDPLLYFRGAYRQVHVPQVHVPT